MQALKQAAREGDSARLDVLCDEWSVPVAPIDPEPEKPKTETHVETTR
jgi:hypothetical protein